MKHHKICTMISSLTVLFILVTTSTAFAAQCPGGSPSQPPDGQPYGLNVQGDASGVKLNGVIEISFSDIRCDAEYEDEDEYGTCFGSDGEWINGPNAATARVAMRLSKNNQNGANNIKAFYVQLDKVPFRDPQRVQAIAEVELRPYILEKFFDVSFGDDSGLQIYLKSFSLFEYEKIYGASPTDPYAEFMSIADLTLAVN